MELRPGDDSAPIALDDTPLPAPTNSSDLGQYAHEQEDDEHTYKSRASDQDGNGPLTPLPTIRFVAHRESTPSQRGPFSPARHILEFLPIWRALKTPNTVIRLGRDANSDSDASNNDVLYISVASTEISGRHCEFWHADGQWHIRDLESDSGTFLNGKDLATLEHRSSPVNDGDIVQLGIGRDELHHRRATFQVLCGGIDRRERHYWTLRTCKKKMIANGWCYHKVEYLAKAARLDLFSYLSNLAPLRQESHEPCRSRFACVAYNVDPATYRTRHVREDCSCDHVATPYDDLLQVIEKGAIPLVSIVEVSGTVRLEVSRRYQGAAYVAISHVWADGLGNSLQCSLPACQLKRLSGAITKLARTAYPPSREQKILFWMDTLCIPVKHKHLALRRAQIDRMASIYYDARACLVLDAELMSISPRWVRSDPDQIHEDGAAHSETRDFDIETYARILCSVWQSRSWCLQEAILPDRIAIHFNDCNIGLFELRDRKSGAESRERSFDQRTWSRPEDWILVQAYVSYSCDQTQSPGIAYVEPLELRESRVDVTSHHSDAVKTGLLRRHVQHNWWCNEDLTAVWNKLTSRSTSMSEDVPLIVSNLLQFDSSHLFKYASPEERFFAIFLRCRNLSISFLSNTGPRSSLEGLRWIPTSISTEPLRSKKHIRHLHKWFYGKFFRFEYFGHNGDTEVSLYVLEKGTISNLNSPIYSVDGPDTYFVEYAEDSEDGDSWGRSDKICIILERQEDWSEWPPRKRGSWFSLVKTEGPNGPFVEIFWLEFGGALRFGQKRPKTSIVDDGHTRIEPLKTDIELLLKYKRLPKVKKLGTFENIIWNDSWFTFLIVLNILPAAAVAVPIVFLVWRQEKHMSTGEVVGACLGFTAALWFGFFSVCLIIIPRYWKAPSAWFYTSSLSAIAR